MTSSSDNNNKKNQVQDQLAKLKADIQNSLGDTLPEPSQSKNADPASLAKNIQASTAEVADSVAQAVSEDAPVKQSAEDLHASIMADFGSSTSADTNQTAEPMLASAEKDVLEPKSATPVEHPGIARTYSDDLSHSMRSDNPATVAELIERNKFEKARKSILAANSSKNILYIFGTLVFIALAVYALTQVFKKEEKVVFVPDASVDSLVYSDLSTGVKIKGTDRSKKRQAIRDATETDLEEGVLNNIYYLGSTGRLGLKDVNKDIQIDESGEKLASFKNNFMHGVYKGDKNYPFLVLKTDNYGSSFQAMRNWEDSLIEDTATYLNLPEEALDRSLVQDGFSDDLIKNKKVRVARYVPRGRDQAGRLLDIFKLNTSNTAESTTSTEDSLEEGPTDLDSTNDNQSDQNSSALQVLRNLFMSQRAIAQAGSDIGGVKFDITNGSVDTNEAIFSLNREKVCFDRISGDRVNEEDFSSRAHYEAQNICFDSYVCRRYACYDNQSEKEVPAFDRTAMKSGVSCEIDDKLGYHCFETISKKPVSILDSRNTSLDTSCNVTDEKVNFSYPGPKHCEEITWLQSATNIKDKQLCFDADAQFITDQNYNGAAGGFCVNPAGRSKTLCLKSDGEVVIPEEPVDEGRYEICFGQTEQFGTDSSSAHTQSGDRAQSHITNADLNEQFFQINDDIRKQSAALFFQLSLVIAGSHVFGLDDNDVIDTLKDAAGVLQFIAEGRILEVEAIKKIALIVRDIERVMDILDPNRMISSSVGDDRFSLYRTLRDIVDIMKSILGIGNSIEWITLGNRIQDGSLNFEQTIYANGGGPEVTAAQQALVLIGILDPVSVSGVIDLVSQSAITEFQEANGLTVTGVLNQETFTAIENIVTDQGGVYGASTEAIINDYIDDDFMSLGSYSEDVQTLQILLYTKDYDISKINGLYDTETCAALRKFQEDNDLELSEAENCSINLETRDFINDLLKDGNYLGSGFDVHENGYLDGRGIFKGKFGPGVVDFSVSEAEASSLREGDIVMLYTFLDQDTVLITTHESVITEYLKRKSLGDIFQKS